MKIIFIILNLLLFCTNADSQIINQEMTLKGHEYTVLCLDIDKTGEYIVSGSYDTNVILWDYKTGKCLNVFKNHDAGVWNVKISPDNKYIASGSWNNNKNAIGSTKNCLNLLDLKTLKIIKNLSIYPDRFKTNAFIPEYDDMAVNGVYKLLFNDEGSKLAAILRSGDLFIWDINNNYSRSVYKYRNTKHDLLGLSPDWKYVVCTENKRSMIDSSFYLMGLGGKDIIARFDKPRRSVISVHFSSNAKFIANISGDRIKRNEIDIWDIQSQKLLFTLKGHSNVVRSVAFSENEKFLASAGEDNLINLWNILTGELIATFTENNKKELTTVLFSPDNKYLITASQDKTIKYWKIDKLIHFEN